jgi:hypothetical protein
MQAITIEKMRSALPWPKGCFFFKLHKNPFWEEFYDMFKFKNGQKSLNT